MQVVKPPYDVVVGSASLTCLQNRTIRSSVPSTTFTPGQLNSLSKPCEWAICARSHRSDHMGRTHMFTQAPVSVHAAANSKTCCKGCAPEVPQHCVVATRCDNPALFSAGLSDPGELALPQGRPLQQGLIFRLQPQQAGGRRPGPHAAFEAVCLLATLVLCGTGGLGKAPMYACGSCSVAKAVLLTVDKAGVNQPCLQRALPQIYSYAVVYAKVHSITMYWERQTHLVCGLHNHEVVLGCGENPLAIIGDIHCSDGATQSRNSCVGSCQAPLTVQPYLTIIRSNDNISLACKKQTMIGGIPTQISCLEGLCVGLLKAVVALDSHHMTKYA